MAATSRRARGNIGIWGVLAFATVTGFMALSIHAGRSYSNRNELQNAADAAALAAAAQLDGTQAGIDAATAAATQFGAAHRTENVTVSIAAPDLTFGSWDRHAAPGTDGFTEITGRTAADLRSIIAVKVRDARLTLPVGFGAFLSGSTNATVRSSAVAVGGGPCEDHCAFPGAFADCMLVDSSGNLRCDNRFYVLNNDWQDNFGLTSLDPTKPASVQNVKDALNACVDSNADVAVPVTNGNPIQPVFGTGHTGVTFPMEVVAPVVHAENCLSAPVYQPCTRGNPNDPCTNARFVGDMTIVGYVSIIVCYVTGPTVGKFWPPQRPDPLWGPTPSSTQKEIDLWNECGPAPTQADFPGVPSTQWPSPFLAQTIFLKHRCHWIDPGNRSNKAGCQSYGLWTTRSRLVQ